MENEQDAKTEDGSQSAEVVDRCRKIGTANTVGELKKPLEPYDNDTDFGFRNQPIQSLFEINLADFKAVVFQ